MPLVFTYTPKSKKNKGKRQLFSKKFNILETDNYNYKITIKYGHAY